MTLNFEDLVKSAASLVVALACNEFMKTLIRWVVTKIPFSHASDSRPGAEVFFAFLYFVLVFVVVWLLLKAMSSAESLFTKTQTLFSNVKTEEKQPTDSGHKRGPTPSDANGQL